MNRGYIHSEHLLQQKLINKKKIGGDAMCEYVYEGSEKKISLKNLFFSFNFSKHKQKKTGHTQ